MALCDSVIGAAARGAALISCARTVSLASLARASCLAGRLDALRGRSVMVAVRDPLTSALVLLELDGVVRRMVLCTPDLPREHLPHVVHCAQADVWLSDSPKNAPPPDVGLDYVVQADPEPVTGGVRRAVHRGEFQMDTEWVLLTSGTTGAPKLVVHTLASLTSAFADPPEEGAAPVWSTFYDIRRYGGLQIYLRALHAGSFVLASAGETIADYLARAAAAGVTHISGTPSHWRKALMSGAFAGFSPTYVRLSGEIADQGILDALRAAFPRAVVAHAFASTEAGVGFEVRDGLAGFPASLAGKSLRAVELDVSRGTLRIRSPGNASAYLGAGAPPLKDAEGFVDLGDRLELRDGRYYFVGRSGGIINVGGLKVHPEEVEAVVNSHRHVRMSLVRSRRNPITGAVVAADVVLADAVGDEPAMEDRIRQEILDACRMALAAHKVPALIRFVPALEMSASGKLVRPNDA